MRTRLLAAAAVVLFSASLAMADEPAECRVPATMQPGEIRLPHLAARLKAGRPVTIVAIGGASTAGAAARLPDRAFPARLQQALAATFPRAAITVINRGVARQTTRQMVARFQRDVIAAHPALVVWETGTVDAVHELPIDDFADAVQNGIDLLKKRAVDIILVDMQFSHRTTAIIEFDSYIETLHRAGALAGIYVFPRFDIMRYWSEQNVFNFDDVRPENRATLAARVYNCIGWRLADAIRRAVR